jgi:hypothetical protein
LTEAVQGMKINRGIPYDISHSPGGR